MLPSPPCGVELLLAPALCGAAPAEGSRWPGDSRELRSLEQRKGRSSALAPQDGDSHSPKQQGRRFGETLENTPRMRRG